MLLIYQGQCPFSEYRIKQFLNILLNANIAVNQVQVFEMFAVQCADQLNPEAQVKCEQQCADLLSATILENGHIKAAEINNSFSVWPRAGVRSPWSSKTTDIIQCCGIEHVLSVEKGRLFVLSFNDPEIDVSILFNQASILHHFYDRMMESIHYDLTELSSRHQLIKQKQLQIIPFLKEGMSVLKSVNQTLGLALSQQELAYLANAYTSLNRNPTDVELMMFAQANSEHCRHKIFNADWKHLNKEGQLASLPSLFELIKSTHQHQSTGILSAYNDNAAVVMGATAGRFFPNPITHDYEYHNEPIHTLIKVETHNHPTAIAPYPGAATGAGGEIRDEGATGCGAKPKAGVTGFSVSNLNIPDFRQTWENFTDYPQQVATSLEVMLQGPIGAARYNNEFGRPNIVGYFRSFFTQHNEQYFGFHKPIMIAGGIGSVRAPHVHKKSLSPGDCLVVLGGPALLIGLGGGAASSVSSGQQNEALDFASVQRENPEIQRRAQEVIDACWQRGEENPIQFIHDVGAGGLSNALPELVKDVGLGAEIQLRSISVDDPSLSPLEIWCNESQERYVLGIRPKDIPLFAELCGRERCPYAVVGHTQAEQSFRLVDTEDQKQQLSQQPVALPMSVLFGDLPKLQRERQDWRRKLKTLQLPECSLKEHVSAVLKLPTVASKSFLITIGDRSVGGLVARDPMVGPWQVPVADCGITAASFDSYHGEAIAIGERSPVAIINPAASVRLAIGEALTNIAAVGIDQMSDIRLSANWMAAASDPVESQALYEGVEAAATFCRALNICIPVGKDSLSMQMQWQTENPLLNSPEKVISPLTLVVTAVAKVPDIRRQLTPQLQPSRNLSCNKAEPDRLVFIDLNPCLQKQLGGSALAQTYHQVGNSAPDIEANRLLAFMGLMRQVHKNQWARAYHDRSDGGLLISLLEMSFAGHLGWTLTLPIDAAEAIGFLFNEGLGAILQVSVDHLPLLQAAARELGLEGCLFSLGDVVDGSQKCQVFLETESGTTKALLDVDRVEMHRLWAETSFRMQALRDNPACAQAEYDALMVAAEPRLIITPTFDINTNMQVQLNNAPFIQRNIRPRMAILREQGINGHTEMAAAFDRAGWCAVDVSMTDLFAQRQTLKDFQGLSVCGGFSFGDVLGAGSGWAKSILMSSKMSDNFAQFFHRPDTLVLGVCNGCQMLSQLKPLIPGADHWPQFLANRSEQYESRWVSVRVTDNDSPWFASMHGSVLPIVVAHGEGRVAMQDDHTCLTLQSQIALQYTLDGVNPTDQYPYNPNGSVDGIAAITNNDGRVCIMMPHPERIFRTVQWSWHPEEWQEHSPWMQLFLNSYLAL